MYFTLYEVSFQRDNYLTETRPHCCNMPYIFLRMFAAVISITHIVQQSGSLHLADDETGEKLIEVIEAITAFMTWVSKQPSRSP